MVDHHHSRLAAAVRRFRQLRVLVLGDPVLDAFLTGTPTRLCTEQPVPVLLRTGEERKAGGAANTAANLSALGSSVALAGVIGADSAGRELTGCLREAGVDTSGLVVDPHQPTCHKLRVLAGEHYAARIDTERSAPLSSQVEGELLERLHSRLPQADLVVVSDYGQGTVSTAAIELVCDSGGRNRPLVLDAKDLRKHAGVRVTLATPNLMEALEVAGLPPLGQEPSLAELETLAERLRESLRAESIAVTLGGRGALVVHTDGTTERLRSGPVVVRSEVGAGDSLVAAAGLGLAAGMDVSSSVRLGMEAAAVAVAKPLTATVTAAELCRRLRGANLASDGTPKSLGEDLDSELSQARSAGLRIVFTNGVFDLLHEGHVDLLRRARALGDLLVVGVNDDASSRQLKGEGRPINNARERQAMLQALDCVDHAVIFEGLTASAVVTAVRPDVYVKGDDHDLAKLPEAAAARQVGAQLVCIPRARSLSTSQIIERVLSVGRPVASKASNQCRASTY